MPGRWMFAPLRSRLALARLSEAECRPRRVRGGAALTLVFVSVLATGAATGSWSQDIRRGAAVAREGDRSPGRTESGSRDPAEPDGRDWWPGGRVATDARRQDGGADGATDDAHELVSRSGDRWSSAYTAREYEGYQQVLSGEYVGIGISVRTVPGGAIQVARVQPGSPAAEADVRKGDLLRAVDGAAVTGLPVTEVVARLRGDAHRADGSPVVLELERDGRWWRQELSRATLDTESVSVTRLSGRLTRMKVEAFTEGSGDRVRSAAEKLPEGCGVLLDLRGNSGGLVSEAVAAASAFLDGGLVATYGARGTERALHAESGGNTEAPLVVLVDGGTMSAAELLVGALRDRGRALVVGSPTFGKGTVQIPREQPDGSVAELTVGEYATPSGRTVEGEGLAPDVTADSPDEAERKARTVLTGLAAKP